MIYKIAIQTFAPQNYEILTRNSCNCELYIPLLREEKDWYVLRIA